MDANYLNISQGVNWDGSIYEGITSGILLKAEQDETFFTVGIYQFSPAGFQDVPFIAGEYYVTVNDATTNKCYGECRLHVLGAGTHDAEFNIADIPITGNQLRVDLYIAPIEPNTKFALSLEETQTNNYLDVFDTDNQWLGSDGQIHTDILKGQTVARLYVTR